MSLTTVSLETSPEMEMPIGEVAHVTGYDPRTLRRLEVEGKIPPSHRVGGTRNWFARDVKVIIDYRAEKIEERDEYGRTTLCKLGTKAAVKSRKG